MAPLETTPFHPTHSLLPAVTSFIDQVPRTVSVDAWRAWATSSSTDPLHPAMATCAALSAFVWVLSEITGNASIVDKLWALLPLVPYSAWFTFWPKITGGANGQIDQRMLIIFVLQILWSIRLHTNTIRRGFFEFSGEDYRWPYVRDRMPKWCFKLLNIFFIATAQNVLLMMMELPQYLLLTLHKSSLVKVPPVGIVDYALAGLFVLVLAIEMEADNQQQRYQALKRGALSKSDQQLSDKERAAIQRGFVTGGLWSYCRHPNFACEQSTWYVMYLFTVLPFLPLSTYTSTVKSMSTHLASHIPQSIDQLQSHLVSLQHSIPRNLSSLESTARVIWSNLSTFAKAHEGIWWNYSIVAPLSMTLLFYSSTQLTEHISSEKYPLYKQYQKRISMFWPPLTSLKSVWLGLTGRLNKTNQIVFGQGDVKQKLLNGKTQ
ncbi:hypothetical protein OIO90_003218 [Microbotryomycetes sp. JL221]|nr:hypothetical protein OIO90_003218 [Microbotryomycetes sp. JL221]